MARDVADLILAEYGRFSDFFSRNEEVGEKRVNYYLGLITAVFAGLITLITSEFGMSHPVLGLTIAAIAEAGLLAVGFVTHLRMKKRSDVTDEYKKILDQLRLEYFQSCGTPGYELEFLPDGRSRKTGGLSTMIFALNLIVALALVITLLGTFLIPPMAGA